VCHPTKDSEGLLEQAELLLKEETSRAEETRKRSDQLLTRIIATAPFVTGLLIIAMRNPRSGANGAGLVGSIFAVEFLLISLFSILGNLGKETFYHPVTKSDLIAKSQFNEELVAAPMPLGRRIAEVFASIGDREQRNEDAIDRLHTSYAAFVVAIVLGLGAGACVFAAPPAPSPAAPTCRCSPA
jgi:hypothetical protein